MIWIIFVIILPLLIASISCNSINGNNVETVEFQNLPKEVQDTITYLSKLDYDYVAGATTTPPDYPELITFDNKYTLEREMIGPWIRHYFINNNETGKKIKIDYPTPMPIIIHTNRMYIPEKMNLIPDGFNSSSKFKSYVIK